MTDKLAQQTTNQFAILTSGPEQAASITAAMKENVGEVGLFDLTAIRFPSGGGTTWEIETLTEPLAEKKLEVVILAAQDARVYYEAGMEETGSGTPPDCSSPDGVTGLGNPGGSCADCPFAQWGSANDGRGKRCSQRKQALVLTKHSNLPYLLSVPPTSLKPLRQYMLALTGQGLPYYGVVTELSLVKAVSGGGVEYAQLVCKFLRPLTPEEREVANPYRAALQGLLTQLPPPAAGE